MRHALSLMALGLGALALGVVAIPWLIFREVQWHRRQRFMGHYEQPVEHDALSLLNEDVEAELLAEWAEAGSHTER